MPKDWIEIRAIGKSVSKDAAVAVLVKAGSPGVVEYAKAVAPAEGAIISHSVWSGAPDESFETAGVTASLTAYLPSNSPYDVNALKNDLKKIGWKFTASVYVEVDWSIKWRLHIRPVKVSFGQASFIVRPPWIHVKAGKGCRVIVIDPGMAFGTGSHATTKTCLKALLWLFSVDGAALSPRGASLLDVGTGSGILAIAAKKLGVKEVVANDIDAVALKVARKNARVNKSAVFVSSATLEKTKGAFKVVVANIISTELLRLAPSLKARLAPKGFLVLSGLLDIESSEVAKAFSLIGLKQVKSYSSKEWRTLVFTDNGARSGE
ncbi:50S ribosomal protein L11 methyltransferase [bacterium]|nr:MAG: 50S ribosomal protein L11 methyltransferase [bacterium]